MTTILPKPMRPVPGPDYRVGRVAAPMRIAAATRLAEASGADGSDAGRRLLASAEIHGIDLSNLWASIGPVPKMGLGPRQVCLAVAGRGRAAMLFTSAPRGPDGIEELSRVIRGACSDLPGIRIAQSLLEPQEAGAEQAFLQASFLRIGRLAYMRRPTPRVAEAREWGRGDWKEDVGVRNYRPGDDAALLTALDLTYQDTLDCPELCGLRDTRDVLDSHRATGKFDPNLWWIMEYRGRPEGAMLLNPCPEQSTIELVYLGLSPGLRAKGLGARLLCFGLSKIAGRAEKHVTCAVDERNDPARRLYQRAGFADFAVRIAMVRRVGD